MNERKKEMFKNYQFNKDFRVFQRRSPYDKEVELIHEFTTSTHENLCFEYGTVNEAVNARQALKNILKKERKPLLLAQRKNFLMVTRERVKE